MIVKINLHDQKKKQEKKPVNKRKKTKNIFN